MVQPSTFALRINLKAAKALGLFAWPLAAGAQQSEPVRRIGVVAKLPADDAEFQARLAAFLQGLRELGWGVGRNVRIEYRLGADNAERLRRHIAEMVELAPDVILANGTSVVAPLLQATRTYRSCSVGSSTQSVATMRAPLSGIESGGPTGIQPSLREAPARSRSRSRQPATRWSTATQAKAACQYPRVIISETRQDALREGDFYCGSQ